MSEICPLCGGEVCFIHINEEEYARRCTNEECMHTFISGVKDEAVPSTSKTIADYYVSNESLEALKKKIEKQFHGAGFNWDMVDYDEHAKKRPFAALSNMENELQEQALDWKKFNSNELVLSMNKKDVYELDGLLDEFTLEKEVDVYDTSELHFDEFESLCDEMSKRRQGPDGLETAAAVEQASLQFNCDTKKPNITTFSDASKNRTTGSITANREAPSSLGTTATIEEISAQTSDFPKFNNTDHNLLKQITKMVPEFVNTDHNIVKQMPQRRSERLKNKNKMIPELDIVDHNILKQMPQRRSERLKNKNKMIPFSRRST